MPGFGASIATGLDERIKTELLDDLYNKTGEITFR